MFSLRRISFLIILHVLQLLSTSSFGQSLIHDLSANWMTYEASEDRFVPAAIKPSNTIHFMVDLSRFQANSLFIETEGEGMLLINHELVELVDHAAPMKFVWTTDSLSEVYTEDSLIVTLNGFDKVLKTEIINESGGAYPQSLAAKEIITPILSSKEGISDIWLSAFLIFGLFVAYLRNSYPKFFETYFSVVGAFRSRLRDENFHESRLFDPYNMIYYMIVVLALLLIFQKLEALGLSWGKPLLNHSELAIFVFGLLLTLLFIIFKYGWNSFFGSLFGMGRLARIQFFEQLRLMGLMLTLIFIAVLIIPLFMPVALLSMVFITLIISAFLLIGIMLFFKLLNSSGYKKNYLFIYICTTELIPLCFFIIFINSI